MRRWSRGFFRLLRGATNVNSTAKGAARIGFFAWGQSNFSTDAPCSHSAQHQFVTKIKPRRHCMKVADFQSRLYQLYASPAMLRQMTGAQLDTTDSTAVTKRTLKRFSTDLCSDK